MAIRVAQVWLNRLLKLIIMLVVLAIFLFSPFYARSVLWFLTQFTPVEVDTVAAQGQNNTGLKHETVPIGSAEWIARQAYLHEVELAAVEHNGQRFLQIERRYPLLLKQIKQQRQQQVLLPTDSSTPHHKKNLSAQAIVHPVLAGEQINVQDIAQFTAQINLYRQFLNPQAVAYSPQSQIITDILAQQPLTAQLHPQSMPNAIVILGGGLRRDAFNRMVPNDYTVKRLEQALLVERIHHLPIVLSGVESPYMQKWLVEHGLQAQFLETNSLNTCENTRFTALLLQRKGGAPVIFLITDAYHMPRSRELFAQNGIRTVPVIAALPNPLTQWLPSRRNWMHTRRANYELLAWLFNRSLGSSKCRETPS